MIYPLILSGILLYISGGAGVYTLELNIAVKSGSPGIMPCVYDKKYKAQRKYWCWGTFWRSCSMLAYANESGKYSISDIPEQSLFTVQWDNLQTSDSGYYWCAVEIRGLDDGYYLYLTVQSAPDVSVVSSSVSGHEDGNVSVQCFYSSGYQNKLKQWCRYKDQSCYPVGRTDTSQTSSVQISDDGRSSFTVLMTGLRLSDSGWYFCSAGDRQIPVQLIVNKTKHGRDMYTTQTSAEDFNRNLRKIMNTVLRPKTNINEATSSLTEAPETEIHRENELNKFLRHDATLFMFLVAMLVLCLLLSLVLIVTRRRRKKPERGHIGVDAHINTTSNTTSSEYQMTSSSPAAATSSASVGGSSVIYSAVIFRKTKHQNISADQVCTQSLSSVDPEGDVIYSSVEKPRKKVPSRMDS
ncbi:uncharacterized protein [Pseudorasbora parva]|uniref:uncharacterized protein n=1 Tax=Pseudorasbora parva TaxID=51549 RepID=UPI00351DD5E6